ncbi:MAG: poly-beta-1,6-N-acetyl-D-glucosamine biosynthesis protein PgaD [Burkholderiales bacterium]|jgi:biofilm PGA synthesis protein PgaD|nr:poly-beta-1,6-N-acetyl-D-glucosamine biosynthesis protein PgaD [Burkholderiales bacterium]
MSRTLTLARAPDGHGTQKVGVPRGQAFDFSPERLVIDRPELMSPVQRLTGMVLTSVAWSVWGYMWAPILALLGWALGIRLFYRNMVVEGGFDSLMQLAPLYVLVSASASATLIVFASWQWIRFARRDRRVGPVPSLSRAEAAAAAGISVEELARWQGAQCLSIRHRADGGIAGGRVLYSDIALPLARRGTRSALTPAPSIPRSGRGSRRASRSRSA